MRDLNLECMKNTYNIIYDDSAKTINRNDKSYNEKILLDIYLQLKPKKTCSS